MSRKGGKNTVEIWSVCYHSCFTAQTLEMCNIEIVFNNAFIALEIIETRCMDCYVAEGGLKLLNNRFGSNIFCYI